MSQQQANPNFYCPITQEIMRDPVVDRDGNSYEREAIMTWLERESHSPITRNRMSASDLVPNRSLRSSIEDYLNASVAAVLAPAVPSAGQAVAVESKEDDSNSRVDFDTPQISLVGGVGPLDTAAEKTYIVSVSSENPASFARHAATIVCVVDTSGSMCSEASIQGVESTGLSMLDIVKHAVRTTLASLGPHDRFGLVSFASTGKVVFDLMPMTEAGKALAISKVNDLKSGGTTNLWDGLKNGLEMLERAGENTGNSAIFLLTDGVPSEIPPRGHISMMQRYRDSHAGRYPGTINTFGFGYSLDSDLLSDMAIEGGGMYAFIPDSGFVGTAFVNALGNHLSSFGKQCVVSIETGAAERIIEDFGAIAGGPEHAISSWGVAFKVPNLMAGTSQDFLFKVHSEGGCPNQLNVSISYEHLVTSPTTTGVSVSSDSRTIEMPAENKSFVSDATPAETFRALWFELHRLRLCMVDVLRSITQDLRGKEVALTPKPEHTASVKMVIDGCDAALARLRSQTTPQMARAHAAEIKKISARFSGMKDDLRVQVTEAISKPEWYTKWGKHYLLSLQRAHLLQQCNNFKDPGIQGYGGKLFQYFRDKADDVFMNLPPPTPSRQVGMPSYSCGNTRASSAAPAPAPISMAAYNDMSGGCVHETSVVRMADGSSKQINQLKKGERVCSSIKNGLPAGAAEVVCMVRTVCDGGATNMVSLDSGLRITPWHPVKDSAGQWKFPASLCNGKPMEAIAGSYVYTFVLADVDGGTGAAENMIYASGMVVDDVVCISLGHGIENDEIASHSFFGTGRVIENLQKRSGWTGGLVTLDQKDFQRDSISGNISGISC